LLLASEMVAVVQSKSNRAARGIVSCTSSHAKLAAS
jgi:hypothetical protein